MPSLSLGGVLLGVATLAYPLVVYLSLDRLDPRWLAGVLIALAVVRLGMGRSKVALGMTAVAVALAALTWWGHGWLPLKLYPVAVNVLMLGLFGWTLRYPPSAIERLARLREPHLPDAAVAYTRRVTQVWCAFFALNGLVAFVTALWVSDAVWTLYNGAISYGLMGLLGGGEWLVRRRLRGSLEQPDVVAKALGSAHG